MTILEEIIAWGKKQDVWLQDALVRLLKNGNYKNLDVKNVTELLLHKCGVIEETSVTPMALPELENITGSKEEHKEITIKKVHSLKKINALTESGELEFAERGLTIIYGTNGSGKSGYSRVLKKCCRARSVDEILPNVFSEVEERERAGEQEATIDYALDSGNGRLMNESFTWKDNKEAPAALKQIWVYDKNCGKIQITEKNEFAYVPFEAQIFEKLVAFVESVGEEVKDREPQEVRVDFSRIQEDTTAHSIITDINNSDDAKTIEEKLANITWRDDHEKELFMARKELLELNKENINAKIKKIEQEISSICEIKETINEIELIVSQGAVQKYQALARNREESRAALDEIGQGMSSRQYISGTGNELWRDMYEAAKEFAADRLSHDHKYVHIDERCVLCQQILDDEAKKRMQSFSEFANKKVKKRLDDLNEKSSSFLNKITDAKHKIDICQSKVNQNFEVVSDIQRNEIMEHLNKIENVRINLCPLLEGNNISSEVQPLKSSASNIIEKILEDANSKKEKIQNSLNADKIKKLENKKRELESNNIANSKRDQINNRIIYLRVSEKYRNAIKRTNTTAISSKAREIVNRSLADRFREKLLGELSCLGGDRLNLLAKPSTIKGKLTYEMSLKEASMQASIDHVFSEGEQNITSLAGFLAETKMSGHKNGIIFDDPVTSLDHLFRERVAERLVKEAKERQVIIFTHDLVFFHELWRTAAELKVKTCAQSIFRSKNASGIVSSGLWEKLDIKGRIKRLKRGCQNSQRNCCRK